MEFYTAHHSNKDPDRLDITVKGKDPLGKYFAPTWDMVMNHKKGNITDEEYTEQYHQRMLKSYEQHQDKWQELLSRHRVILVCFCEEGLFCHRLILAEYLQKLGAVYLGEM